MNKTAFKTLRLTGEECQKGPLVLRLTKATIEVSAISLDHPYCISHSDVGTPPQAQSGLSEFVRSQSSAVIPAGHKQSDASQPTSLSTQQNPCKSTVAICLEQKYGPASTPTEPERCTLSAHVANSDVLIPAANFEPLTPTLTRLCTSVPVQSLAKNRSLLNSNRNKTINLKPPSQVVPVFGASTPGSSLVLKCVAVRKQLDAISAEGTWPSGDSNENGKLQKATLQKKQPSEEETCASLSSSRNVHTADVQIGSEFTVETGSESTTSTDAHIITEFPNSHIKNNVKKNKENVQQNLEKGRKVVRNTARKRTASVKQKFNLQLQKIHTAVSKVPLCQRRFPSENKLQLSGAHSPDKPFKCNSCAKRFSHISTLKVHQRMHEGEAARFPCSFCEKVFLHSSVLKVHLRIHTGERPYSCDKCPKKFRGAAQLTKHRSSHDRVRRHVCTVCSKAFSSDAVLKRHNRVHTGERPYTCEICHKRFSYEGDKKKHLRTHTKENAKKYPCPLCPKRFSDPFTVKSHMRYHTGENLHECTTCHGKFPSPSHLKKHRQVHTGERPHSCFICMKSFSDSFILKKHIRLHTGEKLFGCPMCPKKFNQQNHVVRHMKIHTRGSTERFACSVCNKSFTFPDNLKLHLRLHSKDNPFKCEHCSKMFSSPSHLKRHLAVHLNLKPFTCGICKKAVSSSDILKRHMEAHTGKASFTCGVCLQNFQLAEQIKAHLRTHHVQEPQTLQESLGSDVAR